MSKLSKSQIHGLTGIIAIGVCLVVFQNCGPTYVTTSMSSLASSGSSLNSTPGSYKQNPFVCKAPNVQSITPLLRMTRTQYANNLKSLVGAATYTQAAPLINSLYDDALKKNVKDFSNTISDNQMTAYQALAENVYNYIKDTPAVVQQLGGTCIQQTTVTATCIETAIKKLGLLAFRRPITAAELNLWKTNIYTQGATPSEGLAFSIYAFMLAPDFLLHLELGQDTTTTASYDLTPYEVASRLSYGITDSPPDQLLYDAAAASELSTLKQIEPHVDRLLATAEAKNKISQFFNYWLDPRRYSATTFSPDFLVGLDVNSANDESSREMNEYINYVIFTKKGSFDDLILGQESFARTPAVASIYGHSAVTGSSPAQLGSDRKGLLMRTPVIATEGNETHPIIRGVKFRDRFLCETFGLPSGINTNDPTFFSDEARIKMSTRERTAGITAGQVCMGCHSSINPVGFAFENFDSLGRVRPIETAYSTTGKVIAHHAISTESPVVTLGNASTSVRNGLSIIDSMMQENVLPGCFVKQVSRFYKIQQENTDDACDLANIYGKGISNPEAPVLEIFRQQFLTQNIFKRRMR